MGVSSSKRRVLDRRAGVRAEGLGILGGPRSVKGKGGSPSIPKERSTFDTRNVSHPGGDPPSLAEGGPPSKRAVGFDTRGVGCIRG